MGRIWSRQQEVVISDQSLPQSVLVSANLFVRLIRSFSYSILSNSKFKGKMILNVTLGWEGHSGIVAIYLLDIKGLDLATSSQPAHQQSQHGKCPSFHTFAYASIMAISNATPHGLQVRLLGRMTASCNSCRKLFSWGSEQMSPLLTTPYLSPSLSSPQTSSNGLSIPSLVTPSNECPTSAP